MNSSSVGFIDPVKLRICFELCKKVGYVNKHLREEDFCRRNFISLLSGTAGQFQLLETTVRVILGSIIQTKAEAEYRKPILENLTQKKFSLLRGVAPHDILVTGTISYFLGNKFQLGFWVRP